MSVLLADLGSSAHRFCHELGMRVPQGPPYRVTPVHTMLCLSPGGRARRGPRSAVLSPDLLKSDLRHRVCVGEVRPGSTQRARRQAPRVTGGTLREAPREAALVRGGVRGTGRRAVGRGPWTGAEGMGACRLRGSVAAPLPGEDQRPAEEGHCVLHSESELDPKAAGHRQRGREGISGRELSGGRRVGRDRARRSGAHGRAVGPCGPPRPRAEASLPAASSGKTSLVFSAGGRHQGLPVTVAVLFPVAVSAYTSAPRQTLPRAREFVSDVRSALKLRMMYPQESLLAFLAVPTAGDTSPLPLRGRQAAACVVTQSLCRLKRGRALSGGLKPPSPRWPVGRPRRESVEVSAGFPC